MAEKKKKYESEKSALITSHGIFPKPGSGGASLSGIIH